jgi:hypothetical protein
VQGQIPINRSGLPLVHLSHGSQAVEWCHTDSLRSRRRYSHTARTGCLVVGAVPQKAFSDLAVAMEGKDGPFLCNRHEGHSRRGMRLRCLDHLAPCW